MKYCCISSDEVKLVPTVPRNNHPSGGNFLPGLDPREATKVS